MARIERRIGWTWHYYFGLGFSILMFSRILVFRKFNSVSFAPMFLFSFLFVALSLSGVLLWFRAGSKLILEYKPIIMSAHYYLAWTISIFILIHIAQAIRAEKKNNGFISKKIL